MTKKTDRSHQQLKKIIYMMRMLYIILVTVSLLVVVGGIISYIWLGDSGTNQWVLILSMLMAVLLLFNGYFLFRDTSIFRHLYRQLEIKEASYKNIEALNLELRAQRHDFLNHIQVIYSLMELEAYEDTTDYLNKLYGDVGRLSANIKTDSVAINALLQAKANEAETLGIHYQTVINSRLSELNMPDWELCRVIGNMIDNGFRAAGHTEERSVHIEIREHITDYELIIKNSSRPIDERKIEDFFSPGFTTKRQQEDHGMGLYISRQLMEKYGNTIRMSFADGWVTMTVGLKKN